METFIQKTKKSLDDCCNSMILINNNKNGMELYEVFHDGELSIQYSYLRKEDLNKAVSTTDVVSLMDIANYVSYSEEKDKDIIETLLRTFDSCMTAFSNVIEIIDDFEDFILQISKLEKSIHSVRISREL